LVHGTLGISIATGMLHELGIFHESAVAMMSINQWKFVAPILVGDTLHLRFEITELDPRKSERVGRLGRRFVMVNQREEIVQDGMSDLLIKKRAAQRWFGGFVRRQRKPCFFIRSAYCAHVGRAATFAADEGKFESCSGCNSNGRFMPVLSQVPVRP
jgi:hypothetical protein